MNAPIYLDYNATTPVAPEVADAMLPFLREHFGNPSSSHPYGRFAARAVAQARGHVAALIGARDDEIIFTGCATEANNLALLGVAHALRGAKRHLVVSAIEHPAVLAPATHLEAEGWGLSVVPVDCFGLVSPDEVARAIRPDTALVSVMHANNEVGTIQPIAEIARITRARGVLLHTDAAQTAGKIAVDVDALSVDLLTLAGHEFYAPKGPLNKAVPFTFRLRLPENTKIAAHTHPAYERVTVLSGTLYCAAGDTYDPTKTRALGPGSFAIMPPGTPMFGYTKEETVIQLHGVGPWGLTYLNPADDPRKKQ